MNITRILISLALLAFLIPSNANAQSNIYGFARAGGGETAPTTLNIINPATGALVSSVGPTGVGQITAAAHDPITGILYATHGGGGCCPVAGYAGCLLQADMTTGAVSIVGCDPTFGGNDNMAGLAIDSGGNIYGALLACNAGPSDCNIYLVSVNKTTGALTLIGFLNNWNQGNGMAFGPGDILYQWDTSSNLSTIDLSSGAKTPIGGVHSGFPAGSWRVTDMSYDNASGTMYSTSATSGGDAQLGTVNLATGDITYVGTLPSITNSITFLANACSISTVSVSTDGACTGTTNAAFDVSFDVADGSGDYEVFATAANAGLGINAGDVLGTITGAGATAAGLVISSTLTGPITPATTLDVDVRDTNNPACLGGAAVTINVPECIIIPTIAYDDADGDGIPDIADPCDCTDPLNPDPAVFLGPGGGEIFHELVTVTSGASETWTMDATTIGALDATGAALTLPATMTEISPGVYTLDFYHEINVGYAGDFSNLASSTLSIGNTCTLSCAAVPTLGEWGLIIFTLLLLNTAVFFVVRRRKEVVMG